MKPKRNLKRDILITLIVGSSVLYTMPIAFAATSVVANNQLPVLGDNTLPDNIAITNPNDLTMNITQTGQNGFIKWDSFDVGGSATVNFNGDVSGYNTLNYVNGGNISQIYGTINANNNGNIYIVNPAGVQIGNSAQINVGSLHVSNKDLSNVDFSTTNKKTDVNTFLQGYNTTNAELMSLGNIVASNISFEGERIVIDTDRLYNTDGTKMDVAHDGNGASRFKVTTTEINDVILGYTDTGITKSFIVYTPYTPGENKVNGYKWIENLEQLQAMNTFVEYNEANNRYEYAGYFALRNSIDASATANSGYDFDPIGEYHDDNNKIAFTGRFDGLGYNIFNLNINRADEDYVGLFGYVENATIRNFTLNSGSITGRNNTGAAVGHIAGGSIIENIINTADVTGTDNVGGIVGSATGSSSTLTGLINTGTIKGDDNVGGIIGYVNVNNGSNSKTDINGETYNLGAVTGNSNVGGIAGSATNTTIGSNDFTIYNQLNVTGGYNVGGIVGSISGTTVQNVENRGDVLANGDMEGEYTFHTDYTRNDYSTGGSKTVSVNIANAGGIAGSSTGSTITDVVNSGDVSSNQGENNDYYDAGNVGGVVGSAVDTNITNAENKENNIRGAHNVGGIAGYFANSDTDDAQYTISGGVNNGGDIMATGARNGTGYVRETIRFDYASGNNGNNDGNYIIGNIGGIAGYMDGDNVHITQSGNRGTVHTLDIVNQDNVSASSTAVNVGGIVGKIDRSKTLGALNNNYTNAAVSNSYNTGDVRGYANIGGIAGMMYNGEVAGAYNLGEIRSTRQSAGGTTPLNMGGIVGDTTENSTARAYIYDVYNKGLIGDNNYIYKGRHVGGVVGRLSGTLEKAYNTGDIYNGFNVVGGVVGYWYAGTINNTFNTGNITVVNNNTAESQVGGIVGAADLSTSVGDNAMKLSNSYNLGTLRSFKPNNSSGDNKVGGIVGYLVNWDGTAGANLTIDGVYTLGNLYAATLNNDQYETDGAVGAIVGGQIDGAKFTIGNTGAFYITPEDTPENSSFETIINAGETNPAGVHSIAFANRYYADEYAGYEHSDGKTYTGFTFSKQTGGDVHDKDADGGSVSENTWRIYEDATTPILNAFLPNVEDYFSNSEHMDGIGSIQYGTAYNPLLTIIDANENLEYDWGALNISGAAGLAVYGKDSKGNYYDLTLKNFGTADSNRYFGGTISSEGALTIQGTGSNFNIGSAADISGSSVTLDANTYDEKGKVISYGDASIYGSVTSKTGDISISGGDVEVIGKLDSKDDITINADGTAELLYGNLGTGKVTTDGDLTIGRVTTSTVVDEDGKVKTVNVYNCDSVYIDTDLHIGGNLNLNSSGEMLVDLSNMGDISKENLHTGFLDHFKKDGNIIFSGSDDFKITIDMWDETANNGNGAFNLNKYDVVATDYTGATNHTLVSDISALNIFVDEYATENKVKNGGQDYTYIWVSSAEQLKGIQAYKDAEDAKGNTTGILTYNFALKNNIDASNLDNYKAIASDVVYKTDGEGKQVIDEKNSEKFTGIFDGRDNRIIGLTVGKYKDADDNEVAHQNAGIFGTIGEGGVVENLRVYSSDFTGTTNAGAIAGVNNGYINNVTTLGNEITSTGNNAGGIVGINTAGVVQKNVDGTYSIADGGINDVESSDTVIAGGNNVIAGGLIGTNTGGLLNSYSDSAVTTNAATGTVTTTGGLGGAIGNNRGTVALVDSLGITNGGGSSNVGGIIGINTGSLYSGYNESIVIGHDNVGGIIGTNNGTYNEVDKEWTTGIVQNVVNATSVTSTGDYAGGLVGSNTGDVENGRNNGTITGTNYVGGMVGSNAANSTLTNIVNDSSASIIGEQYVGGIAGSNAGTISANDTNLENRGSITGNKYVGGIAGKNTGTIKNLNSNVTLNTAGTGAQYFGGVAGLNDDSGTITNATNQADIKAGGAIYVGGIAGQNNGNLVGFNGNYGDVVGNSYVGGVVGYNTEDIQNVTAVNAGTVTANGGGAGGLFGENTASIINSTLTNSGSVEGGKNDNDAGIQGTGGLIGVNSGNISGSSLINVAGGRVTSAGNNVGGVIGYNTGDVTGGRGTGSYGLGLYNQQIINNGSVSGVSNVGGLIGTNAHGGSLTAGYNTGSVTGSVTGSRNVGGVAGYNAGTVSNVFSAKGKINGSADTTGGVIGYNSGTLSNAYTDNNSITAGANLIGTNTGTVSAVYSTATSGSLIAENTGTINYAYSFSDDDIQAAGITYLTESQRKQSSSYQGFDENWKFYDGFTLPWLKVFLTEAKEISGMLVAADNWNAYLNTYGKGDYDLFNSLPLSADLYTYWSYQINTEGWNSEINNLGYDLPEYGSVPGPFDDANVKWSFLYKDNPFDRIKNFRERKAEVYFENGGMEI